MRCPLLLLALLGTSLVSGCPQVDEPGEPPGDDTTPDEDSWRILPAFEQPTELFVIDEHQMTEAEMLMIQGLQGIVAQTRPGHRGQI